MIRPVAVLLTTSVVACVGPSPTPPDRGSERASVARSSRTTGDRPPLRRGPDAGPFVRRSPAWHARRSVDACAYPDHGEAGAACIDALLVEPDPRRARYMRRLSDAHAAGMVGPLSPEIAACCHRAGPCGATKTSGHEDCPRMDDGYACLVAAELTLAAHGDPSPFHARACTCDPERARIPVTGGSLACEGRSPVRRAPMDRSLAREVRACGACDPEHGPAACAAEIDRLSGPDPELARYLKEIHSTRCQVP